MREDFCFPKSRRLIKPEVELLLRDGARLNQDVLGLRLLQTDRAFGRIAIAVPKRILKRAVDRNRIKRAIREAFRHHGVRVANVDLLVTLRSKVKVAASAVESRADSGVGFMCGELLDKVLRRFGPPK